MTGRPPCFRLGLLALSYVFAKKSKRYDAAIWRGDPSSAFLLREEESRFVSRLRFPRAWVQQTQHGSRSYAVWIGRDVSEFLYQQVGAPGTGHLAGWQFRAGPSEHGG